MSHSNYWVIITSDEISEIRRRRFLMMGQHPKNAETAPESLPKSSTLLNSA
jgi:hypothetical protein